MKVQTGRHTYPSGHHGGGDGPSCGPCACAIKNLLVMWPSEYSIGSLPGACMLPLWRHCWPCPCLLAILSGVVTHLTENAPFLFSIGQSMLDGVRVGVDRFTTRFDAIQRDENLVTRSHLPQLVSCPCRAFFLLLFGIKKDENAKNLALGGSEVVLVLYGAWARGRREEGEE